MNGAGQTIGAAFTNLIDENNLILAIEEEDEEKIETNNNSSSAKSSASASNHSRSKNSDDKKSENFNNNNSNNSRLKRISRLFKASSISSCSISSSVSSSYSSASLEENEELTAIVPQALSKEQNTNYLECVICLNKYLDNRLDLNATKLVAQHNQIYQIKSCKCKFCVNCLNKYIVQCIENCEVVPVNCPDSVCKLKGSLDQIEISSILLSEHLKEQADNVNSYSYSLDDGLKFYNRYLKLCENIEILRDKTKIYCPRADCQNVCIIKNSSRSKITQVNCEKCNFEFCSLCQRKWSSSSSRDTRKEIVSMNERTHEEILLLNENDDNNNIVMLINEFCECSLRDNGDTNTNKNNMNGDKNRDTDLISRSLPDNFENIKRCPQCSILIERVEGCAQIMCKFCKHCFCFYCLESLDNDFLLKHYTKDGPCKGKLGHSRISLLMHRMSVVAIFTGTIFLILILSPLILLMLPFLIFSSRCRKTCYRFSTKFS